MLKFIAEDAIERGTVSIKEQQTAHANRTGKGKIKKLYTKMTDEETGKMLTHTRNLL